jgi:hypothetical protein
MVSGDTLSRDTIPFLRNVLLSAFTKMFVGSSWVFYSEFVIIYTKLLCRASDARKLDEAKKRFILMFEKPKVVC